MDDMYGGGSVLSYGKVPCTPISGAFANYYDVFGDVDHQRVGTGSSTTSSTSSGSGGDGGGDGDGDETLLEKDSVEEMLDVKPSKSFICKSCKRSKDDDDDGAKTGRMMGGVNDPYIVFLQDKQVEILGALHKEIRILKHENAELKFQIHVILQQHGSDSTLMDDYANQWLNQEKATLNLKSKDNSKSKVLSARGERERILELELESATKMIQELKWLQQHYESKIRTQETKMEDLVRQLSISTSEGNQNIEPLPLQLQSSGPVYVTTKTITRPERNLKSGRQRSSSVHNQHESLNRRNSLQSMLPDDYKEQVATLPPILSKKLGNIGMPIRAPGSPFVPSSAITKQYESMISKSNRRSSSLIRSPTTPSSALPRNNNTPTAFCGDEPSHYND